MCTLVTPLKLYILNFIVKKFQSYLKYSSLCKVTQKKVSRTSSNGPPRSYYGALKMDLKTCAKGTKLKVYRKKLLHASLQVGGCVLIIES